MRREPERFSGSLVLATVRALRQIDSSDEQTTADLVSAFLCAAWPTVQAQNQ